MIICELCGQVICKYEIDFKESGGMGVEVGPDLVCKDLCHDCAKEVAEAVLEDF